MLVNKVKKNHYKWLAPFALVLSLSVAGSVAASGTSIASILPGVSSDTGAAVKATGSSGKLVVSSSGPTYYVQGYAVKQISAWPDSNVASLIAYPGQSKSTTFTSSSGAYYYAKAQTQSNATSIYGEAKVTVN